MREEYAKVGPTQARQVEEARQAAEHATERMSEARLEQERAAAAAARDVAGAEMAARAAREAREAEAEAEEEASVLKQGRSLLNVYHTEDGK